MRQRFDNRELEIQELHVDSPQVLKLRLSNKIVGSGIFLYSNSSRDIDSFLARLLFEVWGVERILLTKDTVTIKLEGIEKMNVAGRIKDAIKEYFYSGMPAIENPDQYSYEKATGVQQRTREREAREILETNLFLEVHVIAVKGNKIFIKKDPFSLTCSEQRLTEIKEHMGKALPWVESVIDVSESLES